MNDEFQQVNTDQERSLHGELGNRKRASELIELQRSALKSRIHRLLEDDARRLAGTDDILSTAWRRIDRVIMRGKLKAESDRQIYAFVHAVIERTIKEKSRASRRLSNREKVAQQIRRSVDQSSSVNEIDAKQELIRVGEAIKNPIDREIVLLRGRNMSFALIAEELKMDPSAVRMRWSRIRVKAKAALAKEEL